MGDVAYPAVFSSAAGFGVRRLRGLSVAQLGPGGGLEAELDGKGEGVVVIGPRITIIRVVALARGS
jgi:hypothetical protein